MRPKVGSPEEIHWLRGFEAGRNAMLDRLQKLEHVVEAAQRLKVAKHASDHSWRVAECRLFDALAALDGEGK